jgi:hypothetical protein
MKRFFGVFVLTPAEQRLIVFVILLLVAVAWFKHQRNLENAVRPEPTPEISATPQGAAVSSPPKWRRFQTAVP